MRVAPCASIYVDPMNVAKTMGFVITGSRCEYYGYCENCSKDRDSASPAGEPRKRRF
jgi:hypothetical protein